MLNEQPLELLRLMQVSRECDRREGIMHRQGKSALVVASSGHEGLAVIGRHLTADDYLVPYYRDRPLMLARGITVRQLARDFLARAGASSGGRNMPMHLSDRSLNVFSVATPTGSQCLPAAGLALALKLAHRRGVVVCTMGDGAVRQGEFYEAVCFAVQEKLPLVFVVEDNGYGISTPSDKMLPFHLGVFAAELVREVDGRDVEDLSRHSQRAMESARGGQGPVILWCRLDRLCSHTSSDDHSVYRSRSELESIRERDPIDLLATKLIDAELLTAGRWIAVRREVAAEVDRIYLEVDQEPPPATETLKEHLLGSVVEPPPMPLNATAEEDTIVSSLNQLLHAALELDSRVVMFGQDIEDPKGGVFGLTRGLSSRFPDRVWNAPLAEATIAGLAVGLAAAGYRPVFEFQFAGFITPAFHQLVTQISTLRWRSVGQWTCPMVLYAPYGAYLPGDGIWHGQSNDGWWCHVPGLRVAVPSKPADVVGLFWSALHDQDPSLILLPKYLLRVREPVLEYRPVRFGQAVVRRRGDDVTVISWGTCLELSLTASERLAAEGLSVEVIDLRTLVPCDWHTISASLARTGRLVVVHEDNRTCGFGQAVISEVVTRADDFDQLLAPPQLVARNDVHIPYSGPLERAALPDVDRILEAVRATLE